MFATGQTGRARIRINSIMGGVAALLLAQVVVPAANAQTTFPTRPVRIILPFGAGGVADFTMRLLAQKLTDKWGQQVVIENKPGGGGTIAQQTLLQSPPDGYSMSVTGNGTAISMSILKKPPYNVLDFTQVSIAATFEMQLATRGNAPFKTIAELLDYAKKNPGKMNLGAINPGSTQNLSAHLFKMMTGIDAQIVTYRTTPDLLTAIIRGDVDVAFDYYAAFKGPLSDKQIRLLAVADEVRNPLLPEVPTVKESGVPDYVVASWNALSAPPGLPADILQILNRDINAALADPDLRAKARELGMNARGSSPQEMRTRLDHEIKRWADVIEKAGIPKQ
jgi:tripartite-type tricarboxylate transporter receptor subunit TctC